MGSCLHLAVLARRGGTDRLTMSVAITSVAGFGVLAMPLIVRRRWPIAAVAVVNVAATLAGVAASSVRQQRWPQLRESPSSLQLTAATGGHC